MQASAALAHSGLLPTRQLAVCCPVSGAGLWGQAAGITAPPSPGKGALGTQHGGAGFQPPCAPGSPQGAGTERDRGLFHMRGAGPVPDLRSQKTMPDSCAIKIMFSELCCSSLSHTANVSLE